MATIGKLVYDIREAIREYTDDSEIDDRYIIYLYDIKRAKYLRQQLNNYQQTVDNSVLQTLCLGLEEVSADECGADVDCETILRTVKPIPTPIELHTKTSITSVKPTNRLAVPFNFVSKVKIPLIGGAIFKNSVYAFLDNDNYIYVTSADDDAHKLMDCITITGVFQNPLDLQSYSNCCGCEETPSSCYDLNTTDYPIQPHFIDLIRREIIQDLLQTKSIPSDRENDSIDEINVQAKNTSR